MLEYLRKRLHIIASLVAKPRESPCFPPRPGGCCRQDAHSHSLPPHPQDMLPSPLPILPTLRLVWDPRQKIISGILLCFSLRVIVHFPSVLAVICCSFSINLNARRLCGRAEMWGWDKKGRDLCWSGVCLFGELGKLNTGIAFLPCFYMQLISCRKY